MTMEKKINIANLLKNCEGMELDCLLFNDVIFDRFDDDDDLPILIRTKEGETWNLTSEGCWDDSPSAKCVIFPKGKTTWEGFHRPFKDGDIIYNRLQKKICIYYLRGDEVPCIKGCRYNESNTQLQFETLEYPIPIVIQDYRFATEEEKARLFDAISTNGYKWNADTKTLEKATKLIFNNGDIVATIGGAWIGITTGGVSRNFMPTYCVIKDNGEFEAYTDVKKTWCFSRLATKEERQKLFQAIKDNGYRWNAETKTLEKLVEPIFKVGSKVRNKNNHNVVFTITSIEEDSYICGSKAALWFADHDKYELVPDKFDITTLKPFDKVLVRDSDKGRWDITFYELYDNTNRTYPHRTLGGNIYKRCIPYEGNEHLMGLVKDCGPYYKTWE